jgi:type I restriction enzyme S subunit
MLNELLVSLESGSRPRGGVQGIREGIPSIGGEHLTYNGGFNFNSIKFVPQDFANKMSKGHIKKNDVLIVKDGATTGKTAFVDEDFPHEKAVVNEHVFICRTTELISPRFLFRYLISEKGKNEILKNFQGSAQGGINSSFVSNTEVPLAPLNEQRRIVDKLEKLLARVNNCKKRLDTIPGLLKRFRQSVLAAACSGRLTADWRERNPDVEPVDRILEDIQKKRLTQASATAQKQKIRDIYSYHEEGDSDLFPKNWQYVALDKLCESFQYGTSKKSMLSGKVPVLRMGNLQNGEISWIDLVYTSDDEEIEKYKLEPGDVLFNRTNSPELVGKTSIYRGEYPAIFAGYLIKISNYKTVLSSEYLNCCLNSIYAKEFFLRVKTDGVHQSNINAQKLGKFEVPFCSRSEQQEIVRRVDALFKIADQIEARYQKARTYVDKLTQSILAKAFRGELVPQDPADETASILLERIRAERAGRELESLQKGNSRRKNPARQRKKAGKT